MRSILCVGLFVVFVVPFAIPAAGQSGSQLPEVKFVADTLVVQADGSYESDPDLATLTFDISTQEKELKQAYAKASQSMRTIVEVAERNSLAKEAIHTGVLTVTPFYEGGRKQRARSYRVHGLVVLQVQDFSKVGPIMDLLAAEITARTGKNPGEHYRELTAEFGIPYYTRIDAPATPEQKAKLEKLTPDAVKESDLAGEPITAKLTKAPGNDAPIGGLKVVAESGWFAARPSGTENIYKIYAESFKSQTHLNAILSEAEEMVNNALGSSAVVPEQGGRT